MNTQTYSYRVVWNDEDAAYIATCPEFAGVSAFGDSPEEALQEARVALKLAIEAYLADGWELPSPISSPEFSGQFRLRLPRSLHAALVERAADEGVSLNSYSMSLLSAGVANSTACQVLRDCFAAVRSELVTNMHISFLTTATGFVASGFPAQMYPALIASSNQANGSATWQS